MGIKIKLAGDYLLIKDASTPQFSEIRNYGGGMRWDAKEKALIGMANLETLDRLETTLRKDGLRLPPDAYNRWRTLSAQRDAVDRERKKEKPTPLFEYPVKMPLYEHQMRAANMALLNFGWIAPEAEVRT